MPSDILSFNPQRTNMLDAFGKTTGMAQGMAKNLAEINLTNEKLQQAQQSNPDILSQISRYETVRNTADPNSPEYVAADRAIMGLVNLAGTASGLGIAGGGRGGSGGGLGGGNNSGYMIAGEGSAQGFNPATISKNSMKGGQYILTDENGNRIIYTSPSQPSITSAENRQMATAESEVIQPFINQGLKHYYSPEGRLQLLEANKILDSKNAPAEQKAAARQKMLEYATARRLIREQAMIQLRSLGAAANGMGEGAVNQIVEQMYPGLPADFFHAYVPVDVQIEAMNNAQGAIHQAADAASRLAAYNFPLKIDGNAPGWMSPGLGNNNQQPQDWTDYVAQRNQQHQQQMTAPAIGSGAGKPVKKESTKNNIGASPAKGLVMMKAPDGSLVSMPESMVAEALKEGAKRVN